MIFIIYSHCISFITRTELSVEEWNKRLFKFQKVISYNKDLELLSDLKFDYKLSDNTISEINKLINNDNFKILRIRNKAFEGFKYEINFCEISNLEGELIYFEDWNFIFRRIDNEYFLWCFIGGIADIQREIKLSDKHIEKYKEIGIAEIDYLIDDLKKLNDSLEYKNALRSASKRILFFRE